MFSAKSFSTVQCSSPVRLVTFWMLSPPGLKASNRMFLMASSKSPRTCAQYFLFTTMDTGMIDTGVLEVAKVLWIPFFLCMDESKSPQEEGEHTSCCRATERDISKAGFKEMPPGS